MNDIMNETPSCDPAAVPALEAGAEAGQAEVYRTKAFPFVRTGSVYCFPLSEALVPPAIPPGESAILTLLALSSGTTYGLTGGEAGHFFYFHPAFGVTHLGTIGTGPVTGGALVQPSGEEIIGGWWGAEGGGLFRHRTTTEAGQGMEQFRGGVTQSEDLALPIPGEGISTLVFEPLTGLVYGLTQPSGFLFALDPLTGESNVIARIEAAAHVLLALPDGSLLGAFAEGRLWQYTPGQDAPQALDAFAPCQMGKRHVAGVGCLVLAANGLVYGGTTTDGYLFRYDPATQVLVNLGKPNRQSFIRALVEGHDGHLHGVIEEPNALAHLFKYDPYVGGFTDLGIVCSAFPEYWQAHSLGSLCVGPFGEIFLGETDRISHLFIYYPPVSAARANT